MNVFPGKIAVITGAGSGIGRELALGLARRRARLALSDVNVKGLEETRALCETIGKVEVRQYPLDVSRRADFFQHAEDVKRDFGAAHYLFNNAGVALASSVEHSSIEDFEWLLGINLWGVIYGTKAFLPIFLAQHEGHIVNISSIFGLVSAFGQGPYNISKFGVRGFTECLWSELKGTGVKATSVHPGGIRTNIDEAALARLHNGEDIALMKQAMDKSLTTPPAVCANDILEGVARGKRKILTGNGARLIDLVGRFFPQSYPEILRHAAGI